METKPKPEATKKTAPKGARLRKEIRRARDSLSHAARACGTNEIVRYLRFEKPLRLTPEEEDVIWDNGWKETVKNSIRGTKVGGLRNLHSVLVNGGRRYEQLVLVTIDQARQIRDSYADREAENGHLREAWDRALVEWERRGTTLRFGEAFDEDEFGDFFAAADEADENEDATGS